jgi:hypothetical protein
MRNHLLTRAALLDQPRRGEMFIVTTLRIY